MSLEPQKGDPVTNEQIAGIENLAQYTLAVGDVQREKNWMKELYIAESNLVGYNDCKPIYTIVRIHDKQLQLFWIPKGEKLRLHQFGAPSPWY